MLNKLKDLRDTLENTQIDLIEAETNGLELTDVLDQIADLAQRLHATVASAMSARAGEEDKEDDGI